MSSSLMPNSVEQSAVKPEHASTMWAAQGVGVGKSGSSTPANRTQDTN